MFFCYLVPLPTYYPNSLFILSKFFFFFSLSLSFFVLNLEVSFFSFLSFLPATYLPIYTSSTTYLLAKSFPQHKRNNNNHIFATANITFVRPRFCEEWEWEIGISYISCMMKGLCVVVIVIRYLSIYLWWWFYFILFYFLVDKVGWGFGVWFLVFWFLVRVGVFWGVLVGWMDRWRDG